MLAKKQAPSITTSSTRDQPKSSYIDDSRPSAPKKPKSFEELMREASQIDQSEFGLLSGKKDDKRDEVPRDRKLESKAFGKIPLRKESRDREPSNSRPLPRSQSSHEFSSRADRISRERENIKTSYSQGHSRTGSPDLRSRGKELYSSSKSSQFASLPKPTVAPKSVSNFITKSKTSVKSKKQPPGGLIQLNTVKRDLTTIEEMQDQLKAKKRLEAVDPIAEKRKQLAAERENERLKRQETARIQIVAKKSNDAGSNRQSETIEQPKANKPREEKMSRANSRDELPQKIKKEPRQEQMDSTSSQDRRGKRNIDEALQDPEYVESNYSSLIQQMFGYDRRRYEDVDSDLSDMEADYSTVRREEAKRFVYA